MDSALAEPWKRHLATIRQPAFEILGNHMTMLYGEGAQCIVEAISTFVE